MLKLKKLNKRLITSASLFALTLGAFLSPGTSNIFIKNAHAQVTSQTQNNAKNPSSCKPATLNEYNVLVLATALNRADLMQKLTSKYCYDLGNFNFNRIDKPHPIFFSPNATFLTYYLQTSRNFIDLKEPESGLDILSYLLVIPYSSHNVTDNNKKNEIMKEVFPYDNHINVSWFSDLYQTLDNRKGKYTNLAVWNNYQNMIDVLAGYYQNLLTLPQDSKGNSPLNYAILTNQFVVVNEILKGPYYNFYKKNADGFTPFHLAFAEKFYFGQDVIKEQDIILINNLLIEQFKPERTAFLDIQDVTFNEFMELMKENNMDLYDKIIKKQLDFKMEVPEIDIELIKDNKEFYVNTMKNYVEGTE